jgi:hypothetical protein
LVGRDSHPLDGSSEFLGYRILPFLSDQHFLVALMVTRGNARVVAFGGVLRSYQMGWQHSHWGTARER